MKVELNEKEIHEAIALYLREKKLTTNSPLDITAIEIKSTVVAFCASANVEIITPVQSQPAGIAPCPPPITY